MTSLSLNPAGRAQAASFARSLAAEHPTLLRSGPEKSIKDTATVVGRQFSLRNKAIKELRELDVGHWAGLTWQEFEDRFAKAYKQWRADPLSIEAPEGETVSSASDRLVESLKRLADKYPDQTIAIVLGRIAQVILRCRLMDRNFEKFWDHVDAEPRWCVVQFSENEPAT